jgi:hypothetical protein
MRTISNPFEQMSEQQRRAIEGLAKQTGLSGGHEAWNRWGRKDSSSTWPRLTVREASGVITILMMHKTPRQQIGPVPTIEQGNQK